MLHFPFPRPSVFPALAAVAGGMLLASSGCAPRGLGVGSGLETDEVYLRRSESFVTDAEYMAFAMQQAGIGEAGPDYYDADRAAQSARSGRQFTPHSNALLGMSSPTGFGGAGMGWGSPFGGVGYDPYFGQGVGFGPGSPWGYSPYGTWGAPGGWGNASSWGNPGGWGYNPYMAYGYNPYGYNPYGPSWGSGGGWFGNNSGWTDNSGFSTSSGPRIPIITSTGTNSNTGTTGLLLQPRSAAGGLNLVTPTVLDQALGRHVDIEVSGPVTSGGIGPQLPPSGRGGDVGGMAPPASREPSSVWGRMLASPSIPDDVREPHTAPEFRTPEPRLPSQPASPARPSVTPPSRPATTPSRPAPSPSRPSQRGGGGGSSPSAPSRSGRGG